MEGAQVCKAPALFALPRAMLGADIFSLGCERHSPFVTPRARAKITPYRGPSSAKLTRGVESIATLCDNGTMIIPCLTFLGSRAGEQRRQRSRSWSFFDDKLAGVRNRGNGRLEEDESGDSLLSLIGGAARLIVKLGQLTVARRVLKRAINWILRVLQISGGRLSWPLLPFADFGAAGDKISGLPKVERSLCYQWYPIVKRRGLAFVFSSAMIAMLIVSGPTNYALQPACS